MSFGARLKEERRRLGFRQAEFAALAGTDVPKQSLYENDRRQLRAGYLARLEPIGVDLLYVLTGRRSEGGLLGEQASAVLAAYLALPDALRESVERLLGDLSRYMEPGPNPEA
ncbi:MAG TPA: helix-turn-helix transcriptional regulator [Allosphingosinicella sp.]|jgi:transcriptional regulator with XRE-family HTH domain